MHTNERGETRASFVRCAFLAGALALLVALAFAPALDAQFVNWDDPQNLADLRAAQGERWHFWTTTGAVDPYQPLAWWSLAIDLAVWGEPRELDGPEAFGFHATSIAIHALAALAFFALARRVLALAAPSAARARIDCAAVFAALVFAVHPLRVESVAWVTERRDVLSGLFFVLAAYAWLRGVPSDAPRIRSRGVALASVIAVGSALAGFVGCVARPSDGPLAWRSLGALGLAASAFAFVAGVFLAARATGRGARNGAWFTLAVVCFFGAVFSKALTVVLPLLLFVLDAWPLRRARRSAWPALVVEKLPLFVLAVVAGLLASWAQRRTGEALADWQSHTLSERIAQALYGLAFYPARTLAPHDLSPAYALPDEISFANARFAVPAVAVIVFVALLFSLRKRAPSVVSACVAFALAIAPVVGLTQAGSQLVADRYSYLSCMPFALLAGGACLLASERARRISIALVLVIAVALTAATRAQASVWRDSETLWQHALALEHDNPIALGMLAAERDALADRESDATRRRALRVEVDALYRRAFAADPTPIAAHVRNFAANLLLLERVEEALEPLARYVQMRPNDAAGWMNYGVGLRMTGRDEEALAHFERAVELDRDNAKAWNHLALAYEDRGDRAGAVRALEQVARLWPKHEPTRAKLAALRGDS